jgi:hypothetical protein
MTSVKDREMKPVSVDYSFEITIIPGRGKEGAGQLVSLLNEFADSPCWLFSFYFKTAIPFAGEVCCWCRKGLEKAIGLTIQRFKLDSVILPVVDNPPAFNSILFTLGLDI